MDSLIIYNYLLRMFQAPDTILGTGDSAGDKQSHALMELTFWWTLTYMVYYSFLPVNMTRQQQPLFSICNLPSSSEEATY